MALGMEIGLIPGDFVLEYVHAPEIEVFGGCDPLNVEAYQ